MRGLPAACAAGAVQMIVFVTVAGLVRPGYDPNRNWVSQLSLGPGGWLATLNMAACGVWLLAGSVGLWRRLGATWGVGLTAWCGACLLVLAALPTDAGIGYPPDVPTAKTTIGLAHQLVAITLGVAGVFAAALLGRCLRPSGSWWPRAGLVVAVVMAATFVAASVLVVLDDNGVLPGNPSGLLERVALFLGLAWIGVVGLKVAGGRRSPGPRAGHRVLAGVQPAPGVHGVEQPQRRVE